MPDKFINSAPEPDKAVVPGDASGLVPSALTTGPDNSGSDAFVAPVAQPAVSPSGEGSEAIDLTRWTNIRPREGSEKT